MGLETQRNEPDSKRNGTNGLAMNRKEREAQLWARFREQMPHPTSELQFGSTFQLLVAVMLSAQCTDKRVNQVTPALFRQYPDARSMAQADCDDVYAYIRSVSYPNAKATHLVAMARKLTDEYKGEVPSTMEALLSLPGVGRKTANVVLSVAFGQPAMAVDTHVFRVSHRLALVSPSANTPRQVEQELLQVIPSADIPTAHHWLLLHGRYVCTARAPHCAECFLNDLCISSIIFLS